jgi:hypothetical protein
MVTTGTVSNIASRGAWPRCQSGTQSLRGRRGSHAGPHPPNLEYGEARRRESSARPSARSRPDAGRRRRDWRLEQGRTPRGSCQAAERASSRRKGSQSQGPRAAARNAAPCAVVSRRRSAEAVSATASALISINSGQSADAAARKAAANRMASERGAPNSRRSTSQTSREGASTMSPASTAHSSPCE